MGCPKEGETVLRTEVTPLKDTLARGEKAARDSKLQEAVWGGKEGAVPSALEMVEEMSGE